MAWFLFRLVTCPIILVACLVVEPRKAPRVAWEYVALT